MAIKNTKWILALFSLSPAFDVAKGLGIVHLLVALSSVDMTRVSRAINHTFTLRFCFLFS